MAMVNYSYQKNLKELARKKKKEEKRLAKLAKKNIQAKEDIALSEGKCAEPGNSSNQLNQ